MAHCFAEVGVPNRYLRLPVFAPIDGHNGRMRYLIALIVGIVALFVVNAFTGIFSLPRPWNSLSMGGIVGITMVIILLIWETVRPSQREGIPGAPRMSDEERAQARADRRARLAAEAGVRDDSSSESAGAPSSSGASDDAATSASGASDAAETSSAAGASDAPPAGAEESNAESVTSGDDEKPSAGPDRSSTASDPSRTASETPGTAAPPVPEARLGEVGDDAGPADRSGTEQAPDTAVKRAAEAKEAERAEADAETVDDIEPDHAREAAEREREREDSAVTDDNRDDSAQGSSLESPPVGQPGMSVDVLDDERNASSASEAASDGGTDGDTRSSR
ncbi:hypothetical protein BC102111_00265 [Brevibacterium casei CIP 102111]|uniref:Uncharacterized protein n=2 Tax=Brevibacterium casei TaxID=33889 RepID=A0A2H1HMB3_9MICO|nr:hypothetical protein BC102111_00265 [Brevibacterium casei CIP 102111]